MFCGCNKAGFCLIGVNASNANKHDQLISDCGELTFYTFASELVGVGFRSIGAILTESSGVIGDHT